MANANENPVSRDWVNLAIVGLAVLAFGAGVFVYVDRDGPGRTEDGVVAADYIEVTANVPGPIAELAVRDNQQVAKGELLFKLDARP